MRIAGLCVSYGVIFYIRVNIVCLATRVVLGNSRSQVLGETQNSTKSTLEEPWSLQLPLLPYIHVISFPSHVIFSHLLCFPLQTSYGHLLHSFFSCTFFFIYDHCLEFPTNFCLNYSSWSFHLSCFLIFNFIYLLFLSVLSWHR